MESPTCLIHKTPHIHTHHLRPLPTRLPRPNTTRLHIHIIRSRHLQHTHSPHTLLLLLLRMFILLRHRQPTLHHRTRLHLMEYHITLLQVPTECTLRRHIETASAPHAQGSHRSQQLGQASTVRNGTRDHPFDPGIAVLVGFDLLSYFSSYQENVVEFCEWNCVNISSDFSC
uniref:Uncharacterized protein n=1 Tax=Kalanchoe fedtschenkoi TaxID=63787 RepID=A0A7N0VFC9_KALFE